ncbi:YggT family protein [Gilliamella sp. B2717]|uniref:YggT family protein n=1 Tax=Gilliamella sp. B2717 TaxID=2817996 RepID=UPI00226ACBBD|nr:YggT family protein [Gilliamella sp. B2717]MCX8579022.1 YggT family protein [Gilliamella sp. B2717]
MELIYFLGKTVITFCLYVLILRLWMQQVRINFHNPITQFIVKVTQPIIGPLRRFIPSVGKFDYATWLLLYLVALIKILFIFSFIPINLPFNVDYLWFALVAILHAMGYLLFWLLLFRAVLSWISRGQSVPDEILYQLTEPLMAPIRRFIPPIGMIDVTFAIVAVVLMFMNYFATKIFGALWIIL